MEGLPYDFGIEDGPEKDKDKTGSSEKKGKQPSRSLIEAIKAELEPKKEKEVAPEKHEAREILLEPDKEVSLDVAPELTEAPLEQLSRVEVTAISQTLANERLAEIQEEAEETEQLSSANLAAESFLEAVEVSGDIDQAYAEAVEELGETALDTTVSEVDYETETALPVDPESLMDQARSELTPNVMYNIRQEEADQEHLQEPEAQPFDGEPERPATSQEFRDTPSNTHQTRVETTPAKNRKEKLHTGLVDYVVGRRFGRLTEVSREDEVEKKLESEISDLKLKLASRENHVRQLAVNKNFEKKPKKIDLKQEKRRPERLKKREAKIEEPHIKERAAISAHTMRKAELLDLAGKIEVEGTTLKQMYEGNVLGEKGLRRVMAEYLRGGNFKKFLTREIVEREKDFERDPKLRDQGSRDSVESKSTNLEKLLSKTGIDWEEPRPTVANKEVDTKTLEDLLKARDNKKITHPFRLLADVLMVTAIVALAATIVVLEMGR